MPTPTFSGASYQLNPSNSNDSQNSPAVAALDDGRFATVYRSTDALGGTLRYVIHNGDGSIYREQTIVDADNEVYIDNEMVNMAALEGGGFVITWSERLGADENIYHRVYGADGLPVTEPIHSNADMTDGLAKRPDVVGDGQVGSISSGTIRATTPIRGRARPSPIRSACSISARTASPPALPSA